MFGLMNGAGGVRGQSMGVRGDVQEPLPPWQAHGLRRARLRLSGSAGAWLLACCLLWVLPGGVHAERRVALVIGNADYEEGPLSNPLNDARDMRALLLRLGFAPENIVYGENLRASGFGALLASFRERLTGDSVALVFYAGHAVQLRGENYLLAIDAKMRREEDLPQQALRLSDLMGLLGEAKSRMNLVFLDSCRNNPFAARNRGSRGMAAPVDVPAGTLVSYAAEPGKLADDGPGRNGLFTAALLAHLPTAGLEVRGMFIRVVRDVLLSSNRAQRPWQEGSTEFEFFFVPATGTAPVPAGPPAAPPASANVAGPTATTLPADASVFRGIADRRDTAGLANRLAAALEADQALTRRLRSAGLTVEVGFAEDLARRSPRENRIFGQWYLRFPREPRCNHDLPAGWLGRSGLGGLPLSRDDAVRTGLEQVSRFLQGFDRAQRPAQCLAG